MVLVDVLDHADLELARQEEDRQHRQKHERGPRAVSAGLAAEAQQLLDVRQLRGTREQVGKAAVQAEGDEHADREEGEQLDDRLERDRRDHAFVALGRVGIALPLGFPGTDTLLTWSIYRFSARS